MALDAGVLMAWALSLTHYPPIPMPIIKPIDSLQMAQEACGGRVCNVLAFQTPGTIYISNSLDTESAYGAAIIVHELVHALQPIDMPCRAKEIEAWGVQDAYLVAYGEYPVHVKTIDGVCK